MKKPLVKICGLTNYKDAEYALEQGAHFLGFIFHKPSPRCVSPEKVAKIIARLKEKNFSTNFVGVFVNSDKKFIEKTLKETKIDYLQFHGEEDPDLIKDLAEKYRVKTIKAFRISKVEDLALTKLFQVDYFLFDTFTSGSYGGTGQKFDWNILEKFSDKNRLFLAGGIKSDNLLEAVENVNPYALDLSSSLEKLPGQKDLTKIKEFFTIYKKIGG